MSTVLVTGANRGIGYEHVRQYAQKNWNVIACARHPENSKELAELKKQYVGSYWKGEIIYINFERR